MASVAHVAALPLVLARNQRLHNQILAGLPLAALFFWLGANAEGIGLYGAGARGHSRRTVAKESGHERPIPDPQ